MWIVYLIGAIGAFVFLASFDRDFGRQIGAEGRTVGIVLMIAAAAIYAGFRLYFRRIAREREDRR